MLWYRRAVVLVAVLAGVLTAITLEAPSEADAQTARAGNFKVIKKRGDAFRNYDLRERTVSRTKVDWAVGLLFWNDAEIDKVKGALGDEYDQEGSAAYARLKNNGGAYVWDDDKGRKTTLCPGLPGQPIEAYHYRIYATPGNDRMLNRVWGYYTFATTHIDHEECPGGDATWFGRSETAENYLASIAAGVWGSPAVRADHRSFGNGEPFRREGNHIWDNNKYATYIKVP
jgi:hypothetical protein